MKRRQRGRRKGRASSSVPACETNPSPSTVTSTMKLRPSCCTLTVILPSSLFVLQQAEELLLRLMFQRPGLDRGARLGARCALARDGRGGDEVPPGNLSRERRHRPQGVRSPIYGAP